MGKRQRCGNSNKMSSRKNRRQLVNAAEIKLEPGIKEEPQPIGNLATVSAKLLDNRGNGEALIDHMESDDEEGKHTDCSFDDDVKIKVKNECDEGEKKGKEPKSKAAEDGEANSQQNKHPQDVGVNSPANNRNGNNAHAGKKPIKVKDKGRASKQHQCTQCDYVAPCKSKLARHLLKHTGEKPFACKQCSKAFTSKQGLQNHMKVHAKEFLFNCSVCLRGFDGNNEKTEHETSCKSLRYECHLCKKSFGTSKTNLIRHMRVHNGEKAFECKECSKQFTAGSSLNKHMKLHAGPRPFRCSKCLQAFSQQIERNEHESKCNRRTFECYACGKVFGLSKAYLDRHMRTHTGDKPFACTECPRKFSCKYQLNDHQKVHLRSLPWKCEICRKGFPKPTQCKAHQRSCRRRGYECCLCKKFFASHLFNLKKHILTHTGEKPFKCEICQNRFTRKGSLKKHINSIHNKKS